MEIHHYTKAATLPLILASRKIRFTRADFLDDKTEVPFRDSRLDPRFYFVSSWSAAQIEQAGQWIQYGDQGKGVRITLRHSPFDLTSLNVEVSRPIAFGRRVGLQIKDVLAPFCEGMMFGNGYLLMPDGAGTHDSFGSEVIYDPNPALWAARFVTSTVNETTISGQSTCIARVKSDVWADQREFRYVLMAAKGPKLGYANSPDVYKNALLDQFETDGVNGRANAPTEATSIDLPFSPTCLEHLAVTFGPKISAEDRQSISTALAKHAPHAVVRESTVALR
ncbi:DUF2971 domain-containing protein [Paraburkholderia sediminicola]|uniref:hypothetical protein n=1 Tax=Paraburkholderia TaxID=1822464 RepID=UPI0038BA0B1F